MVTALMKALDRAGSPQGDILIMLAHKPGS